MNTLSLKKSTAKQKTVGMQLSYIEISCDNPEAQKPFGLLSLLGYFAIKYKNDTSTGSRLKEPEEGKRQE